MTKYQTKATKEERVCFGSQFKQGTVCWGGEGMVAEAWGDWGHPISRQSGSRKMHSSVQLGFSFSFRQGTPAQGMVLLTMMLVSPPSRTQSSNFLTNLPRGWSPGSSEILSSWESLSIITYWNERCNWEKQIKILTEFVSQVVTFWCLLKAMLSVSNASPGQSEQPSLLHPTVVYSLSPFCFGSQLLNSFGLTLRGPE